jgi:hypothetical protein
LDLSFKNLELLPYLRNYKNEVQIQNIKTQGLIFRSKSNNAQFRKPYKFLLQGQKYKNLKNSKNTLVFIFRLENLSLSPLQIKFVVRGVARKVSKNIIVKHRENSEYFLIANVKPKESNANDLLIEMAPNSLHYNFILSEINIKQL